MSRAEGAYARALKEIARHVGAIIAGSYTDSKDEHSISAMLNAYADALKPWATATARRMIEDVNARDLASWKALGREISAQLRFDITRAPVGETMRALLGEQVGLIQSLPIEAAQRVHEFTLKGLEGSLRQNEVAAAILRSSEVAQSRAVLIARTEVARTASVLTQSRAVHIGSTHYVWETAHDRDVRPGHKAMQGKVCEWANPPAVNENGRIMYHHPGQIWNCRCWPRPIIPTDPVGRPA